MIPVLRRPYFSRSNCSAPCALRLSSGRASGDRRPQQTFEIGDEVGISKRASASLRRPKRAEGCIVRVGFEQGREPVDRVQYLRDRDEFVVLPCQMSAHARPRPILRLARQARPHRIETDMAHRRDQWLSSIGTDENRLWNRWPVQRPRALMKLVVRRCASPTARPSRSHRMGRASNAHGWASDSRLKTSTSRLKVCSAKRSR
jgi:hypothetical protein